MTKNLFLTVLIVLSVSLFSQAQVNDTLTRKPQISIETDPATFAFGGYAAHIRVKPANCDHLLLGLGTYAMDMPSIVVDINSKNRDKGWSVRINQAYGAFVEHHFNKVNDGVFVGGQLGLQQFKITKEGISNDEKFWNILAMGYVGYTIKPFANNFYLKPWAGIGYTTKISGENKLAGNEYDIAPVTMFVTLHFGYTF